ncbi:MAG: DNA primase [Rhodocyclaceae bacterium]|jgi:DNA primase|nr:DNA primase [Rhodocyclaceae bacterium]
MIPQSFIQELLARVDIVDVIERHLPLKKGGVNYFACCPFHGEKSPSFSVSPSKQFYHCFGCGAHGSAIGFLMEYQGLTYVDAIRELAGQLGMAVPEERDSPAARRQAANVPLTELMAAAARFYREQLKLAPQAIDYLKTRGLTGEIAARFGIGYAPDGWNALQGAFPDYNAAALLEAGLVIENDQGRRYDRFRDRIMFPIQDSRGNVIGFGGRVLGSGEPKYLNSPETPLFEKGRELYGIVQARQGIRDAGCAIVVEGYMDVVALAQFGVSNAVATLGTATTPTHIQKLFRQTDRVVFCFDGDAAGRKAAWRALESSLEALADDKQAAFLFLPPEHDPDSFVRAEGAEAFRQAATSALPLVDFLLRHLREDCDAATAEGRARLVHEAKPLVLKLAAPLLRLQLVKAIAKTSDLTQAEVEAAYGLKPSRPAFDRQGERPSGRPQPRRRPLSPVETLLRLVIQHPTHAARLPLALIPQEDPEGRALVAILDAVDVGDIPGNAGLGLLLEHFRDTPHAPLIAQHGREGLETEFEDSAIEPLLQDTLARLRQTAARREFEALNEKARGTRLSPEEMRRLQELLLAAKEPVSQPKVSN